LQDLLTQLASQTTTAVAPTADFEKEINSRACQFGLNAALLGKTQAKPEVAEAFLKTMPAYAQKLEVSNEKLRSELTKYKVVSEIVIRTAGRNRDADYYNRFSEANEPQERRQRLCGNESDRRVGGKGIVVSLVTTQPQPGKRHPSRLWNRQTCKRH
jgi:hypothetical protein